MKTGASLNLLSDFILEKTHSFHFLKWHLVIFGCSIFVDLQKAFDTVEHDILLAKLEHFSIHGMANNWLESYLFNRK